MADKEKLIVSRERVADHGEVYTGKREVNAMLDLVKQETERIESKFLEPACGTGNFLVEILERKLQVVIKRYKKSQVDFERYGVLAVSSIYGIDIIMENVEGARERLFELFCAHYSELFKSRIKENCLSTVKFLLKKNIIHGNALTLATEGGSPQPIIFSEWSLVNAMHIKRRDFNFEELMTTANYNSDQSMPLFSDQKEEVFIPTPVKEHPLVHYLKISNAD